MDPRRPNPSAPPVYRPTQKSPQMKPVAPPVYRPNPPSPQMKRTAPPVYRPSQAASQLKRAAPPVYRPNQSSPQRKPAPPPVYRPYQLSPQMKPARPHVVQAMQRDKWDVDEPMWGITLPQGSGSEEYKVHVRTRHVSFLTIVMRGVAFAQKHGVPVQQTLFSDTAEGQLCTGGNNFSGGSYHAAHLCRPTLNLSDFPAHLTNVGSEVHDLYLASINTTNQRRSDNLGPDKIIDAQQTTSKRWLLTNIPLNIDRAFYEGFVQAYLQGLVNLLTPYQFNADSYGAAYAVTNDLLGRYQSLADDIYRDVNG